MTRRRLTEKEIRDLFMLASNDTEGRSRKLLLSQLMESWLLDRAESKAVSDGFDKWRAMAEKKVAK